VHPEIYRTLFQNLRQAKLAHYPVQEITAGKKNKLSKN